MFGMDMVVEVIIALLQLNKMEITSALLLPQM